MLTWSHLAEPLFENPPKDPGYFCMSPSIQEFINKASHRASPAPDLTVCIGSSRDPFARLPFELRVKIATLLSTATFYNLRYASRPFIPIFNDNMFWKTRFSKDGDRGFLHPVAIDGAVDWRSLYRATARCEDTFGMRMKVWETLQWIRERLKITRTPSLKPLDFYGRALQDYHADSAAQGQRTTSKDAREPRPHRSVHDLRSRYSQSPKIYQPDSTPRTTSDRNHCAGVYKYKREQGDHRLSRSNGSNRDSRGTLR